MATELLTDNRNKLLDVKTRTAVLDDLVVRTLAKVRERYLAREGDKDKYPAKHDALDERSLQSKEVSVGRSRSSSGNGSSDHGESTGEFLKYVQRKGIGAYVLRLTTSLNKTRMDETSHVLLATPGVLESILLKMFRDDKANPKDIEGLRPAVLLAVEGEPREFFYKELLKEFLSASGLSVKTSSLLNERLLAALVARGVPLASGKTAPAMKAIFEEVRAEGDLHAFVNAFAARGEINKTRFTNPVKQSMVDYLEAVGLQDVSNPNFEKKFEDGDYDEYFVQAYHQAVFGRNGGPASTQTIPVRPASEEFRLPTYDFLDEQGIVPESIHAAAVLYQMYFIGDKLGLFELPNALLLRRAHGTLDLPSGPGSQLLQKYKKLQRNNDDVPPEERMLLYKRVFDMGGGKVLEDTAVNPEFLDLWDTLAREVTTYITKDEISDSVEERISRAAIEEAIQNLQGNLSFYAADIDEDVRIMQEQYLLAEKVLRDPQIMASIGLVRRQTLQAAIEKLIAEDSGAAPMVKKLFKLGTKGQEILHFIAAYDSSTPEDKYREFLRLMESWIVARGSLKDEVLEKTDEEPEEDDEFDEDDSDDQDADWES